MKVTAVFLVFLFVKMSSSVNYCDEPKCHCFKNELTCDELSGELDYKAIHESIVNLTFKRGTISTPEDENVLIPLNNVNKIEFTRCILTNVYSLTNFKNLIDLNISQSELNLKNLNVHGTNIKSLEMSECSLKLPNKTHLIELFKQMPQLEFLSLVGNNFTGITDDFFAPLTELVSLELDSCSIQTISPLLHFHKLENFDVTTNQIKSLPVDLLKNSVNSLKNFEVGENPLDRLDVDLNKFKVLELVELGETRLVCNCTWMSYLNMKVVNPKELM